MYKLIRLFNQNRKKILIAILAIVFVIGIIQFLNNFYKEKNEQILKEILNENVEINTSMYNPSYSIITGTTISKEVSEESSKIIDEFIKNCNKGNIEEAYNLLSNDCKKELYPNIEEFKKYHNQNFKTKKDYTIQLWSSFPNIYKVELTQDILALGKIDNTIVIQDFYTIVMEDGENKLNISEYIGKQKIGKMISKNGIVIKTNYKNIFKNYEIYNIEIENETSNTIRIDSSESTKTMYLEENEDIKYTAYTHEIDENNYIVKARHKNVFDIKYSKSYKKETNNYAIVFSDIIMNYDKYKETKNKKEYIDRIVIRLDI